MIVFLALRQHLYTVAALCDRQFGPALPVVRGLAYETMLRSQAAPRATYIFTDIERLSSFERGLAADLFRSLQAAGCRCLNDPARVLTRYPMLRALHQTGRNPFNIWRLEDGIGAAKFPVFLRHEGDHGRPLSGLLETPAALEAALARLPEQGQPLHGVIAVEFCAAPMAPGIWSKFGTFRIGEVVSTDHAVFEDDWCVKHGVAGLATSEMLIWERDHVGANSFAAALRPVFELAGIEYGRADHATVAGREVVYEINTNPYLAALSPQVSAVRDEMVALARARYAAALWGLDAGNGALVKLPLSERATHYRLQSAALGAAFRP
jgi:hypothetical protein